MARLSDFKGRASKIAIATPGEVKESLAVATLTRQLGNLPDKLHPDCKIYWVHKAADQAIAPFEIGGRAIIPVPVEAQQRAAGHFRWIQDPFICLQSADGLSLLLPSDADEISHATVCALALALGCPVRHTDLHLEGGNILQLGDNLLLGKDIAFQNGIPRQGTWLKPDREAWEALECRLKACFDAKRIVWVGTQHQMDIGLDCVAMATDSWQPFFHLDLFVMPGGMGADGGLRVFLGEIWDLAPALPTSQAQVALDRLRAALDQTEKVLLANLPNIKLARLPIMTVASGNQLSVQSLCNGWYEDNPANHRAYLPDFGRLAAQDQYQIRAQQAHRQAERVMQDWGILPRWIEMDFPALARDGGALHCAVKVLERQLF